MVAAPDEVVPGAAEDQVVPVVAIDRIVPRPASDDVVSVAPVDRVVCRVTAHDVRAAPALEKVRARAADRFVVPVPAVQEVSSLPTADHVVASETEHRVVAAQGCDHVRSKGSDQDIPTRRAEDRGPEPITSGTAHRLPRTTFAPAGRLAPEAHVIPEPAVDTVMVGVDDALPGRPAVDDVVPARAERQV